MAFVGFLFVNLMMNETAWAGSMPPDWSCTSGLWDIPRSAHPETLPVIVKPKPQVPQKSRRPAIKLNMVRIEPGTFKMGSPRDEAQRDRFEGPLQLVTINYAFEVGKYEVTFDDWAKCVAGGGCRGYRPSDMGWGKGRRPVINVSWKDTQSYIRWLNSVTGKTYRLLSEAEWEYVARAGTDTPFYTGVNISSDQANFNGQHPYMLGPKSRYRRKTVPVGSFKPNRFGVYDILGNVFEWTQDCWNESHVGNPSNGAARTDGDCNYRLMKGGSWVNHAYQIRAAKRTRYTTDFRYDDYGFRIARTLK